MQGAIQVLGFTFFYLNVQLSKQTFKGLFKGIF